MKNEMTNYMKQLFSFAMCAFLFGCTTSSQVTKPADGAWLDLYDGTSVENWTMIGPGGFTPEADGSLVSHGGMGLFYYSAESFKDFELELDWKVESEKTNSGIFVRFARPELPMDAVNSGNEIQIDDSGDATHRTGSIYNFGGAQRSAAKPYGEWNTYKIRITGQRYEIWLNEIKVNDFFSNRGREGYVGLQNHDNGSIVRFKNIRARELPVTEVMAYDSPAQMLEPAAGRETKRVLMLTHTNGFRHTGAIDQSKILAADLSEHSELQIDVTEDMADITKENLANYDVLLLSNTTLKAKVDKSAETEVVAENTETYEGTFKNYQFMVETPQGDFDGKLELDGSEDDVTGHIQFKAFGAKDELKTATMNGTDFEFTFENEVLGEVSGKVTLEGQLFEGTLNVMGGNVPIRGSQPGSSTVATTEESQDAGSWRVYSVTLDSPQGKMNGRVFLNGSPENLSGKLDLAGNVSDLQDVVLDGDKFSGNFDAPGYGNIKIESVISDEAWEGKIMVGEMTLPFPGERVTEDAIEAENMIDEASLVTAEQREAILGFVSSGGGLVAAHSALDAFYEWPEYREMVGGGLFVEHPWTQSVKINVEEPNNPSVSHFGESFWIADEIYVLDNNPRWNGRVLLSMDMPSVGVEEGPSSTAANDYPISWIRKQGEGKVFVTKLGHFAHVWSNPDFVQHLAQGIRMAAGTVDANFSGYRVKEVVAEGVWPDDIAIDDEGDVWIAELRGKVWHLNSKTDELRLIAEIPTTNPTNIEHGLYGLEVDPDFYNGEPWVYAYYAERETFINTLSRYRYEDGMINLESEEVLIRVPTEPQCCHQAGDIEWGPDKTLYLSTGDTGQSAARPEWRLSEKEINDFKELNNLEDVHWSRLADSERSAQNLQDLRGKILRINRDGTIPMDNPFFGKAGVRWEVYAYGLRNPYRFKVDPETEVMYIGVVGPDASFDYDEYNISIKGGENYGWPRTIGKLFYNEWTPDDIPGYVPPIWEYNYEDGGRSATFGPIYKFDGEGGFPDIFQDKVFIYDWARRWIKWAEVGEGVFTNDVEEDVRKDKLQYSKKGVRLINIRNFDTLTDTTPISMELAPDGSIYVAEFDGFWDAGPKARVTRYRWVSDDDTKESKVEPGGN